MKRLRCSMQRLAGVLLFLATISSVLHFVAISSTVLIPQQDATHAKIIQLHPPPNTATRRMAAPRTSKPTVNLTSFPHIRQDNHNYLPRTIYIPNWNQTRKKKQRHPSIHRNVTLDILCYEDRTNLATANRTVQGWAAYAKRQGYRYTHVSQHIVTSETHAKFNKYAYILQLFQDRLNSSSFGEQWVLWVDSDILLVDPSFSFESSVLEAYAHDQTEIVLSRDCRNKAVPINNGIFLIRNSPWSIQFLQTIIQSGPKILEQNRKLGSKQYGFQWDLVDQPVFTFLLIDRMKELPYGSKEDTVITRTVSLVPTRTFNSFCRPLPFYMGVDYVGKYTWSHGDPILHLTGLNETQRAIVMDRVLETLKNQTTLSSQQQKGRGSLYNPCTDYSYVK